MANGTKLQSMLENNELDFALIEGSVSFNNLLSEEFAEDRLILLLSPDSKLLEWNEIKLADLQNYPLLVRENKSISRILLDHIYALHNLPLVPFMESVSTHAIVECVHEGLGIAFLPEHLVRHSVNSGMIATRPVADEGFSRKNYIVWHKNKLLTASVKDFISLCHKVAAG